ncbi:MAG: BrnT family toxin [Roseitalea sp.]|nr:BrnT family toxin [Roseitalea sp.]MBO6721267.1 BrnT family toxin [Roseitalea sp.]MBO6742249.1 BrnT family toxin [Roseitalea sp.]
MRIEYEDEKRKLTLFHRGLDMAEAALVFAGSTLTLTDDRHDYGEDRFITVGTLHDRMVVIVWTPRADARRIISLRKANAREQTRYRNRLD